MSRFEIPNGDFENWDGMPRLFDWNTNSCPVCVPDTNPYTVQKESNYVYHGRYAALLIYNYAYPAWAENKFPITFHPSSLTGYVRCINAGSDSVCIKIKLVKNRVVVDSGQWVSTSSISNYEKITIPITQHANNADSVLIRIQGGHKYNSTGSTSLWVDYLNLQ